MSRTGRVDGPSRPWILASGAKVIFFTHPKLVYWNALEALSALSRPLRASTLILQSSVDQLQRRNHDTSGIAGPGLASLKSADEERVTAKQSK